MKIITKVFLKKETACTGGYAWYLEQKTTNAKVIFNKLMDEDRFNWANWTIVRMFNRKQKIQYAIFATEQCIANYEKQYPGDGRPRLAIEAAKSVLKNNNIKTRSAESAAWSAWSAAESAESAESARKKMQIKILNYGLELLGIKQRSKL